MSTLTQDAPRGNRPRTKSDPPDDVIVCEWPINKRETARVSIAAYKGSWLINIRKWFEGDDGGMRPGKGFALSVKHLPRLAEATAAALTVARERGLIAAEADPASEK
jgi:hypothetical protein